MKKEVYLAPHDRFVAVYESDRNDPCYVSNLAVYELSPEVVAVIVVHVTSDSIEDASAILSDIETLQEDTNDTMGQDEQFILSDFPTAWAGTFGALSEDGTTIDADIRLSVTDISDSGRLEGCCEMGYLGMHPYNRTEVTI